MKILYINSVVDYGSTGNIVRDLSNHEKSLGNEVLICYGRNYKENAPDTFYFGSSLSTYFHVAMTRLFGRNGLHSTRQTKALINKIKDFNPDIIHLHNIHGYYLNVPKLFKFLKESNIKIMWTLHDCWAFSGSGAHFDYDGCKVWQEGCVVCNSTSTYPEVFGLKNQRKTFNWKKKYISAIESNQMIIITPSYWLNKLTKSTFLKKFDISTIYNGIDLSKFSPKDSRSNSNQIQLLAVANEWTKYKGLDDFISLSTQLDSTYKITMVGLNKKQIKELPSAIRGINRTSNLDELINLYKNSDIYLNLSYEETMGLTTAEALACGTPCIVYDATAVPEVIDDTCGVTIPAGDIDSLQDAIRSFDFNNFSIENCLKRAENFDLRKMIVNYSKKAEELYEKD